MSSGNALRLRDLGIDPVHSGAYAGKWLKTSGPIQESVNPATGEVLGRVHGYDDVATTMTCTHVQIRGPVGVQSPAELVMAGRAG
jgi:hypothetical protein